MLGRGRPDLFSFPVLPYCALPNNIFTCTFLLLTVGDLVSEPYSHLLQSETIYWAELWLSKSLYAYVLCHIFLVKYGLSQEIRKDNIKVMMHPDPKVMGR